jgi:hypothetical protein
MKSFLPVLAFALLATAAGCSDDDSSNNPEGSGTARLRIHLTDAPYPYSSIESADVTIESVVVGVDDELHTLEVEDAPLHVNLLDLQNGVTEEIVDADVPDGSLNQIRLIISSASVTLTDGRVFDLQIPSGESSGLKVFISPPVTVDGSLTTELLLDFDVSKSFKPIPASARKANEIRRFQFHPVLRVANLSTTGTIYGNVWNNNGTSEDESDDTPLVGASVTVLDSEGDEVLGSTATDDEGSYRISGVRKGTHLLRVEADGFETFERHADVIPANQTRIEIRMSPTGGEISKTSVEIF